jgi:hypothetical protein
MSALRETAVARIGQALREEFPFASEGEILAAAELYDEIARTWAMPTEQLVTWLHLQAEPTVANFKRHCAACRIKGQRRANRRSRVNTEYPD